MAKTTFPDKPYFSLKSPDIRNFANDNPRDFLKKMPNDTILDEVQRIPLLFSYLQEILDDNPEKGIFILTGSNNFLLQENISQTLAGRMAYLNLLPFTAYELKSEIYCPNRMRKYFSKDFIPQFMLKKLIQQIGCPITSKHTSNAMLDK